MLQTSHQGSRSGANAARSVAGATALSRRACVCGNQISGASRHRRNVVPMTGSARRRELPRHRRDVGPGTGSTRWRGGPRRSPQYFSRYPNSLVEFHTAPRPLVLRAPRHGARRRRRRAPKRRRRHHRQEHRHRPREQPERPRVVPARATPRRRRCDSRGDSTPSLRLSRRRHHKKLTPRPRREIIGKKKSRPEPTMPTSADVATACVMREK